MPYSAKSLDLQIYGSSGKDELIVRCPFPEHDDSTPSASFNTDKGVIYCFGCGQSATANQIAELTGGYVSWVYGSEKYKPVKEQLWRQLLLNPLAIDNEYLAKRGVDHNSVMANDIRANANSIIFPLRERGFAVGVQIRQFTRNPKYLTFGKKIPLWPDIIWKPNDFVFVVESIFSAIRLHQFSYQAYATLGAMLKPDIKDTLRNYTKVRGIFDNDKAGLIASGKLLKLVPHAKVMIHGCDPSDFLDKSSFLKYTSIQRITSDIRVVAKAYGNRKEFYERI